MESKYRPLSADHARQNYQEKQIIRQIENLINKLDNENKKIERQLNEMDNDFNRYLLKTDLIKELVLKINKREKIS